MPDLRLPRNLDPGALAGAVAAAARAGVLIRRVGPNFTVNIIITSVDPQSVPDGQLVTNVNIGAVPADGSAAAAPGEPADPDAILASSDPELGHS